MTRTSYTTQKSRLEKEISKLQKQMQTLQAKQRRPILTSIVRSMREYSITPEEITAAFSQKSAGRRVGTTNKATATKRVIPPKYRHPDTGATWTGRGKPPRWVSDAEAAGTPRTSFLIQAA
ncbi:MAG TPA: H-NS histone family protein [Castellaniella sp.]|uniref:H-NS histone family protein n=1 Tax=Castellaniella sp. TaxID=1955812 RepID=UPI002EDF15F3